MGPRARQPKRGGGTAALRWWNAGPWPARAPPRPAAGPQPPDSARPGQGARLRPRPAETAPQTL